MLTLTNTKKMKTDFTTESVSLEAIGNNPLLESTQTRAKLNHVTVNEYTEAYRNGAVFPPITLFFDGSVYWVADGFHRLAFMKILEKTDITANVYKGGYKDAVLFGLRANNHHGLRPSQADKRAMVMKVLQEEEILGMASRDIAELCGVSHTFVLGIQEELEQRELRAKLGEETVISEDGEEGESDGILKDKNGNIIPEHLIEVFKVAQIINGHVKVFATEIKQLSGLQKDVAAKEEIGFEKLAEELKLVVKSIRSAVKELTDKALPLYIFDKDGEPTASYLTKNEYEGIMVEEEQPKEKKRAGRKKKEVSISDTVKSASELNGNDVVGILSDDESLSDSDLPF